METTAMKPIEDYLTQLQDEDYTVRLSALESLSNIGDPATVPAIARLLFDIHFLVVEGAFEALVKMGESALPALHKEIGRAHV